LDDAKRVSAKSSKRLVNRSAADDHQIRLLLPCLFGRGSHDVTNGDPERRINPGRFQQGRDCVSSILSNMLLESSLALESRPVTDWTDDMQEIHFRSDRLREVGGPPRNGGCC
jgi:hypothetical protein